MDAHGNISSILGKENEEEAEDPVATGSISVEERGSTSNCQSVHVSHAFPVKRTQTLRRFHMFVEMCHLFGWEISSPIQFENIIQVRD